MKTSQLNINGIKKATAFVGAFLLSLSLSSQLAKAELTPSIAAVFAPSLTSVRNSTGTAQSEGVDHDRKFGLGGGILLDAPLAEFLSFGTGAIYSARKFTIRAGSVELERSVPTIFVPVEAKFWIADVIALGGGGFAGIRVGDVKDTVKVNGTTLGSITSSNRDTVEWGWTASATAIVPVAERTGILIGARYLYGLSDAEGSAYNEKIDDLMFMAGVSIGI